MLNTFCSNSLGSSGKELLPRTYLGNTGFNSQGEQRLASAHVSTHEPDQSPTFDESETGAKVKKKKVKYKIHFLPIFFIHLTNSLVFFFFV